MWECTGGSAVAGDDSITAAIREVKEETGLEAKQENGKCMFTIQRENDFCDVWLFRQDFDIRDIILQENETIDAKYATAYEIHQNSIVKGVNYIEAKISQSTIVLSQVTPVVSSAAIAKTLRRQLFTISGVNLTLAGRKNC